MSKIEKTTNISTATLDTFIETAHISPDISDILSRNLNGLWEIVLSYIDMFDSDILEEVVLYDNSYFKMSTPTSLVELADGILETNEHDKVLDICSGVATFPVYALQNTKVDEYTGVELNFNANDIAILRGSLLGDNYSFVINNACLLYTSPSPRD